MRLNTLAHYADFVIGLALMVVLAAGALFGNNLLLNLKWLIYGCLGFATWTCVEYVIHRWVYHHVPVFREVHNAHHAEPCAYIGAPPLVGLIVILAVFFAPVVSTSFNVASGLTTGVLSGYLGYMFCPTSAPVRQIWPLEERRISGSS